MGTRQPVPPTALAKRASEDSRESLRSLPPRPLKTKLVRRRKPADEHFGELGVEDWPASNSVEQTNSYLEGAIEAKQYARSIATAHHRNAFKKTGLRNALCTSVSSDKFISGSARIV